MQTLQFSRSVFFVQLSPETEDRPEAPSMRSDLDAVCAISGSNVRLRDAVNDSSLCSVNSGLCITVSAHVFCGVPWCLQMRRLRGIKVLCGSGLRE